MGAYALHQLLHTHSLLAAQLHEAQQVRVKLPVIMRTSQQGLRQAYEGSGGISTACLTAAYLGDA